MSRDPVDQAAVDAFLHERGVYLKRGLLNRVAEVDAQLKQLGVDVESASPTSASETTEVPSGPQVVEEAGGSSVRRKSGRRAG